MGIVVNPLKAFKFCHGYKFDHELILWSDGVIGTLSDEQEKECKIIAIENVPNGPKIYHSVEEALNDDTPTIEDDKISQFVAIKECAHLMHIADETENLIKHIPDTWAFMDYCMSKFGFGKVDREIPANIKNFIDEVFKEAGISKSDTVEDKLKKLDRFLQQPAEQP